MGTPEENEEMLKILKANVDSFFVIVIGIIIFFMQGGFALLEAGAVRSKNTVNILIKNMLDVLIGGVAYWAVGWGLAYGPGGNPFCGGSNFLSIGMNESNYPSWFFQFVFAATAATIISGCIAERVNFFAYLVYSIIVTGLVYPPVSHWAWDSSDTPGFLKTMGYKDFAGSGVVHLLGAVCGLIACWMVGPRLGRFDDNGKPIDMPGHSVPLAGLGGFILLFGFLAFNGGSQASISNAGDAEFVARAVINTILGSCGAGLTVLALYKIFFHKKWSYLMTLNGALAGMVATCAGCNVYQPWSAILVGMLGGGAFVLVRQSMIRGQLDDPLDAVAVHGAGGFVGVLCVPFFEYNSGIFWTGDTSEPWKALGINVLGLVCIIAWSVVWSLMIFWPLKKMNWLRIDRDTELLGNDIIKHGESAYPAGAWAEVQYSNENNNNCPSTPSIMTGTRLEIPNKMYNKDINMM